jgi:hypothetical protein
LTVKPEFTITDPLPATYEGVYNACRSVVTVLNQGEDLYNILKIELEQSVGNLSRLLASSGEEDVAWLVLFNKAFAWFEEHIVSIYIRPLFRQHIDFLRLFSNRS